MSALRLRTLKQVLLFAALGGLLVAAAACGGQGSPAGGDGRLLVVSTVPVIYSLVANVTGEDARLENLLPPGSSPHQVNFTPAQAKLVAEADVVVKNGAGLDFWADDLIEAAGTGDLVVVEASQGLQMLKPDEPALTSDLPADESDAGHAGEDVDPHVWLDARNAQRMAANIAEALIEADPGHAGAYRTRVDAYAARLEALHQDILRRTSTLENRRFVAFHSAFQYYARAYGLEQVGVIARFPGQEPSPQYLGDLVDLVKSLDVRAIFTEPQFSSRPAEVLAQEAGVETYEVDPEGAELSASGYEDLMRENTDVFVRALSGD